MKEKNFEIVLNIGEQEVVAKCKISASFRTLYVKQFSFKNMEDYLEYLYSEVVQNKEEIDTILNKYPFAKFLLLDKLALVLGQRFPEDTDEVKHFAKFALKDNE